MPSLQGAKSMVRYKYLLLMADTTTRSKMIKWAMGPDIGQVGFRWQSATVCFASISLTIVGTPAGSERNNEYAEGESP
jgi:hypothetical protein